MKHVMMRLLKHFAQQHNKVPAPLKWGLKHKFNFIEEEFMNWIIFWTYEDTVWLMSYWFYTLHQRHLVICIENTYASPYASLITWKWIIEQQIIYQNYVWYGRMYELKNQQDFYCAYYLLDHVCLFFSSVI